MILFPEFATHYKINVFVMIFDIFPWTPITGTAHTDVFLGPLSLALQIPTFSLDPYHWHCKNVAAPAKIIFCSKNAKNTVKPMLLQ